MKTNYPMDCATLYYRTFSVAMSLYEQNLTVWQPHSVTLQLQAGTFQPSSWFLAQRANVYW